MAIKNPLHVNEITPEWLTRVLRESGTIRDSRVIGLHVGNVGGAEGFLSSVVKASLEYDRDEDGSPRSLVIKIEPESESYRQMGDDLHAFEREIGFYRDIAPGVRMRLPHIYGHVIDPPAYAVVMEDLSALRPGDQVAGVNEEEALEVVGTIAKLHASYWNSPELSRLGWMPLENNVWQDYGEKWLSFIEHFGCLLEPEGVKLGEKLGARVSWLAGEIDSRPKTVIHSDLRADNLLFGRPDSDESVVILDWQLALRSMAAFDVARLTGGSEPTIERRAHQYDVIDAWLEGLKSGGVNDYSRDDAVRDYKLGLLLNICYPVHFHVGSIGATGRTKELLHEIITRDFASALDFDAGSVLPA
jgi:hypothetical protein